MIRPVFLIWVGLFASTLASIYFDESDRDRPGAPLGYIISLQGDVKIRPAGDFIWSDLSAQMKVFEYDVLSAGGDGRAVVRLIDGSKIELLPNSQLKIAAKRALGNQIELSLMKGNVQVSRPARKVAKRQQIRLALNTSTQRVVLDRVGQSLDLEHDPDKVFTKVKTNTPDLKIISRTKFVSKLNPDTLEFKSSYGNEPGMSLDFKKNNLAPEVKEAPSVRLAARPPPPKVKTDFPSLSTRGKTFWSVDPFPEGFSNPLPLPYRYKGTDFPIFIASLAGKNYKFIDRSRSGIYDLLLEDRPVGSQIREGCISLNIAAGVLEAKASKKEYVSRNTMPHKLCELSSKKPIVLGINSFRTQKVAKKWYEIGSIVNPKYRVGLAVSSDFRRMIPLILGSNGLSRSDFTGLPNQGVFVVRGEAVIAYVEGPELNSGEATLLMRQLGADLVYMGQKNAYLGGKKTFNPSQYLKQTNSLFYIHRARSIRLDPALFKTHVSAKKFLDGFNSHFLGAKVKILATK